ncbi:hypothetical protein BOW07_13115 [Solemya velum gill symbiont]|nr:hypothetical protein BOW07_13115 [Solemya velum gill symbiont]OOZ43400.1 hypothetical protein BOW38_12425 [Solemya velum gill symbiont]
MDRKQFSWQIVLYPPPWIEEPPSTFSEGKWFDTKEECLKNLSEQPSFDHPDCYGVQYYVLHRKSLEEKEAFGCVVT